MIVCYLMSDDISVCVESYDLMNCEKLTREEIRANFHDFRYLSSVEDPNIMREFVRYEDVVKLINKMQNDYN